MPRTGDFFRPTATYYNILGGVCQEEYAVYAQVYATFIFINAACMRRPFIRVKFFAARGIKRLTLPRSLLYLLFAVSNGGRDGRGAVKI